MKLFYGYHKVPIVKIVRISYKISDVSLRMASYGSSEFANPKLEIAKENKYHICPINVFGNFSTDLNREGKNKNSNARRFIFELSTEDVMEAIEQLKNTEQGFSLRDLYMQKEDGRIVDMTGRIVN